MEHGRHDHRKRRVILAPRKSGLLTRRLILACILLLIGSLSAQTNYYVNAATGNDSNTAVQAQNPSTPWLTISHAVAAYTLGAAGAVIHVAGGTYGGTLVNCSTYTNVAVCIPIGRGGSAPNVRLVIQCDTALSCLIRNTSARYFFENDGNNVDIVGFDAGNGPNVQAALIGACNPAANGPCPTSNSFHILNNYFHDVAQTSDDGQGQGPGCTLQGMIEIQQHHGASVTDLQIIGNWVDNYAGHAPTCQNSHGIYVNSQGGKIQNNLITRITSNGSQVYDQACTTIFTNNTVLNSGFNGLQIAGADGCTAGLNTITNNIFDNNTHSGVLIGTGGGGGCDAAHQILLSNNMANANGDGNFNGTSSCVISGGNVTTEAASATFINSAVPGGNYHLKSTSLAVSGGASGCVPGGASPCIPSTDKDGVPRPAGGAQSIGAYVLVSSGVPIVN